MTSKVCLLMAIVIVFILLFGTYVFAQDDKKQLTATEVLHFYEDSLAWQQLMSMQIDIKAIPVAGLAGKKPYRAQFVFHQNHGQVAWNGRAFRIDENDDSEPNFSNTINQVITNGRHLTSVGPTDRPPLGAMISANYEEIQKDLLESASMGGPLWARIFGNNHKSVTQLLGESTDLHLHTEKEDINAISCYVLEGSTQHGKVTAWIAPEKGYNALRWKIRKTGDDLVNETSISTNNFDSWTAVFDTVEFEKVGDIFVTKQGNLVFTVEENNGNITTKRYEYNTSNIQLNPDFEVSGAFKVNLPNGTRVSVREAPGVHYIWQDGNIVPDSDVPTFDEIDRIIDELKDED